MVDLVDEDKVKEEDVEDVIESNHVQKDEEKSSLLSESELKMEITVGFDVIDLVVVQEIESEKEILQEVKPILKACVDVVPEEIPHGLPPMGDIPHQINLILSSIFLNKPSYKMSPKEDEELKRQVDDLLNKGLIQESKIPCVAPTLLAPNKDGSWRMYVDCQPNNNLFVHEEVRFDVRQIIKQYED